VTCEVAVANRLGIALAADSAATFTQSGTGARTYATGANKIFQIAEFDPVGCMIFNNSALAGIPWELLIKAFRAQQHASLQTVQDYCDDFRDFIAGQRSYGLLPQAVRRISEQTSLFIAMHAVLDRLQGTFREMRTTGGLEPPEAAAETLRLAYEHVNASAIVAPLSADDLTAAIAQDGPDLAAAVARYLSSAESRLPKDLFPEASISELVFRSLFQTTFDVLSATYTGIVVAGFGETQYLPSCVSIKVYGFVAGKLIFEAGDGFTMEHTGRDCFITPFATSTMVETFMLGASSNVYGFVQNHFLRATKEVCRAAFAAQGIAPDQAVINQSVETAMPKFMEGWIGDISQAHLLPLLQIVGGLSLGELGELADTLVMLESLKEKVTYRTQSVGGPVDVALITKADGLVWIKRKLYFDSSLNHRYLARMERKHRSA